MPKDMEGLLEEICRLPLPSGYAIGVQYIEAVSDHGHSIPIANCQVLFKDMPNLSLNFSFYPERTSALSTLQTKFETEEFFEVKLTPLNESDDLLLTTDFNGFYEFEFTQCSTIISIRLLKQNDFDQFMSQNQERIQAIACSAFD